MSKSVIELKNVSFSYTKDAFLHGLNMTIKEKDFVGIVGPNGGGKTTVLKLIVGLIKPREGEIKVMGASPEKGRKYISYISQHQEVDLDFPITVFEILAMGRMDSIWKKYSKEDITEVNKHLEQFKITDLKDKTLRELSGGERQRVFLAQALVSKPKILILDEPINNVDGKNQVEFYKLLKVLSKEITIVVVDHNLEMLSDYVSRVVCVNKCRAESIELHDIKNIGNLNHSKGHSH